MPEDDQSIDILIDDEIWNQSIPNIEEFVKNTVNSVLDEFEPPFGNIDILLCNDARIHELNNLWRGQDKPTNVLSFEAVDDGILGNIAIAHDYCQHEAIEQKKAFKDHITHMIAHGVLHLIGFDHIEDDEAQEMETLEVEILSKLGINNPYETDEGNLTGADNAKF
jgi:probable rRNA maturation factor